MQMLTTQEISQINISIVDKSDRKCLCHFWIPAYYSFRSQQEDKRNYRTPFFNYKEMGRIFNTFSLQKIFFFYFSYIHFSLLNDIRSILPIYNII